MAGTKIGNVQAVSENKKNQTKFFNAIKGPLASDPEFAVKNEQVLRFILLVHMLKQSGMCTPDIKECVFRYVRALSRSAKATLSMHLPGALNIKSTGLEPTLQGISLLSDQTKPVPVEIVSFIVAKGRSRLAEDPAWMYGARGWWTHSVKCMSRVYRRPERLADGTEIAGSGGLQNNHHFAQFSAGVFAGVMARLRLVVPETQWQQAGIQLHRAYREALWEVFGIFTSNKHFENVCQCADKSFALPEHQYTVYKDVKGGKSLKEVEGALVAALKTTGINAELGDNELSPSAHYDSLDRPEKLRLNVFEKLRWTNKEFRKLTDNLEYNVRNKGQALKPDSARAYAVLGDWYGKKLQAEEAAKKAAKKN